MTSNLPDDLDVTGYPGETSKPVQLPDGRTIRVRVEYDADSTVNDYDADGTVSGGYDYNRHGHDERPAGFDGNAEKLQVDRGGFVWWQPPEDVPRSSEHFTALRDHVRNVCEGGFYGIILEVVDGEDAYGSPIVRETASLWGVECDADEEYRRSIVSDLLDEVTE